MELSAHLEIGMAALTRGLVDLKKLARLVVELQQAATPSGEDFWLRPDLLSRDQLDEIKATLAVGSTGMRSPGRGEIAKPKSREVPTVVETDHKTGMGDAPTPPATEIQPDPTPHPRPTSGGGRYMRLGALGTGGMGEVAACIDLELGRRVAVKALRPDFQNDLGAARMLEREARVTGSLEHPNIVPVYDLGHRPEVGPYYVMRIVDQPSLSQVLVKLRDGEADAITTFSQGRLLRHFIQICETVDYAHSRGVIHCDLKPANILLGSFGEVLVVDWGLAYKVDEGTSYRGGTPGYMAPEQLDNTHASPIDARTDVFALGVILYELLALEPFADTPLTTIVRKSQIPGRTEDTALEPGRLPAKLKPSMRSPDRKIPPELDEICVRALAEKPEDRFQSARELASALEQFLEGTRERERRAKRANDFATEGDRLAESYHEFLESRPERLSDLASVRAQLAPWEPTDRKRALWDEEDRLAVTEALGVRTLQAAISAYEQALDEIPGQVAARRGLARLYQSQLERAIERGDALDRLYFEELVKQYDDGTIAQILWGEGRLRLETRPTGMISLGMLEEKDRRLVPSREICPGTIPPEGLLLPPGRYIATVLVEREKGKGEYTFKLPLLIRPGREAHTVVDLEVAGEAATGEVLVPGGPALLGGDPISGAAPREVEVPSFFLARNPVTFAQFLDFLVDLRARDVGRAELLTPRTRDGAAYFSWDGKGYIPNRILIFGVDAAIARSLPVFGIDLEGAESYARWRSEIDRLTYRLPTEDEWEKAARGTDGRLFPWGDHFDASFCKMRQSRPGPPRPEAPGSFAIDESPYGVCDMAGGIADWVIPSGPEVQDESGARLVVSRGGAWSDWASDCSVGARRPYLAVERSSRVGFRLARTAGRVAAGT